MTGEVLPDGWWVSRPQLLAIGKHVHDLETDNANLRVAAGNQSIVHFFFAGVGSGLALGTVLFIWPGWLKKL